MALQPLGPRWQPLIERVLRPLRDAGALQNDSQTDERLRALLDGVVSWNARLDLTAARSPEELADLMLADAAILAAQPELLSGGRIVDVGSGAGAPGLPLAILVPGLQMTLVEPKQKRVAFLRTTTGQLARPDIVVRRARADELEDAAWDAAVSRATLPPDEWVRVGARLATGQVAVLLARVELPEHPCWRAVVDHRYTWPLTGAERRLVVLRRTIL